LKTSIDTAEYTMAKTPVSATSKSESAMKKETHSMPVFTTANALEELWNRASTGMPAHERKWFAQGAASEVSRQTQQLATVVEGLGCLIDADENCGAFQEKCDLTTLLFNVSNQLSGIAGLAHIAEFAASELNFAAAQEGTGA
jgi:hypothetical protein